MKVTTPGPNYAPDNGLAEDIDVLLSYGTSHTEMAKMLLMCRLEAGEESLLPTWLKLVAKKGTNDNTKN